MWTKYYPNENFEITQNFKQRTLFQNSSAFSVKSKVKIKKVKHVFLTKAELKLQVNEVSFIN